MRADARHASCENAFEHGDGLAEDEQEVTFTARVAGAARVPTFVFVYSVCMHPLSSSDITAINALISSWCG